MEEYALVSLGNLQSATDFLRAPPLDVPQRDDLPLSRRKPNDRALHPRTRLVSNQALFGLGVPALRVGLPVARPTLAGRGEPVRIDSRLACLVTERREGKRA